MPAGPAAARPGNGEGRFLADLVNKCRRLTRRLSELTPEVGTLIEPSWDHLEQIHQCVSQLVSLIIQQVVPARDLIKSSYLIGGSPSDFDKAMQGLQRTAITAHIAIDNYMKTIEIEKRKRRSTRLRTNRQFVRDQATLQEARIASSEALNHLILVSEGFVRALG